MTVSEYSSPIDIMNRAIQHVGGHKLDTLLDDTVEAKEMTECYDKLRQAELRRNVWVFATRRTIIRPFDSTTYFVTPAAWSGSTTYLIGDLVTQDGIVWQNTQATNHGNSPDTQGSGWEVFFGPATATTFDTSGGTSYYAGELVVASNATKAYVSLISANTDTTFLTAQWTGITSPTLAPARIIYPVGTGPVTQSASRNIYFLPNGYLRKAPQDPKAGSLSIFGASTAATYNDWQFENKYFITREVYPIAFRFVADVTDVSLFDPMFCEGLAARMAMETVERITQSSEKKAAITQAYGRTMGEARLVNGIESDPIEQPEDDFISCRV